MALIPKLMHYWRLSCKIELPRIQALISHIYVTNESSNKSYL